MFLGGYSVTLAAIDVPEDRSSPAILGIGDSLRQTIDQAGDHDWYGVQLYQGTDYVFRMQGADAGGGALSHPVLELYDEGGQLLAAAPGTDLDAVLQFEPNETGKYFVAAEASGSATGSYTLSAAVALPAPPSPATLASALIVEPHAHADEVPPSA